MKIIALGRSQMIICWGKGTVILLNKNCKLTEYLEHGSSLFYFPLTIIHFGFHENVI